MTNDLLSFKIKKIIPITEPVINKIKNFKLPFVFAPENRKHSINIMFY